MKARKILFNVTLAAGALCASVLPLCAADLKVTFVDVGIGDSIHIQTPSGKNYLIDGGDTSDPINPPTLDDPTLDFCPIVKYLLDNNIRTLDFILKTHDDSDHYKGLEAILGTKATSGGANVFTVKAVVYSSNTAKLTNLASHSETTLVKVSSGTRLETVAALSGIWDTALTSLVLYPRSSSADSSVNSGGVVLKIIYGQVSYLFTADTEAADETNMMSDFSAAFLKSTVLKVAHHGSRSGSTAAFLDKVKPEVAAVSVAANAYGLPDAEILQRLSDKGAAVYRTDRYGSFTVQTDGVTYSTHSTLTPGSGSTVNSTTTVTITSGTVSARPAVHVYPNPAPGKTTPAQTTLVYELNGISDGVRVAVYTLNGELVRVWDDAPFVVGRNAFVWDLKNGDGEDVVSGLYFVQVEANAGGGSQIGRTKMAVLRQ